MQQTNIVDIGKGRTIRIPVNYQQFIVDYSSNPEDCGWEHFYAKDPLNIYEHLYILETKANGTREIVSIDD